MTTNLKIGSVEEFEVDRTRAQKAMGSTPSIAWTEERGVELRGSTRRSSLKGREKAIVSQTNIHKVFQKAMLGTHLRDGVERI